MSKKVYQSQAHGWDYHYIHDNMPRLLLPGKIRTITADFIELSLLRDTEKIVVNVLTKFQNRAGGRIWLLAVP
jgi:hypothetical protein